MTDGPWAFAARAPRAAALLLPLGALCVTAAALGSAQTSYLASPSPVDRTDVGTVGWLLAPALAGVLLARRRRPVAVLLVSVALVLGYYASGRPAIGLEIPLAAAFFSAALEGRSRPAVWVAGGLLVVAYGYRLVSGQSVAILGIQLTTSVLVLAGAVAAGEAVRSRAEQRAQEQDRARLLALQRDDEVRHAADDARREVALDVHDVLGHSMVVITTQASLAEELVEEDPEAARRSLRAIRTSARGALDEIRQSLRVLTPAGAGESRAPVPTIEQVPALVAALDDVGPRMTLVQEGVPRAVPVAIGTTAWRIVREALTNVLRHADARAAVVTLTWAADSLTVDVTDDGTGASTRPGGAGAGDAAGPGGSAGSGGAGLTGMAHRAETVGGHLEAGPSPHGAGFRVRAELPLPARTWS